jgi:Bacterial PH domain
MRVMSTRARWWSAFALGIAAAAVMPLAMRSPRLTLLNAALRVDYGWAVGAAALAAALLLVGAAVLVPRRWARAALAIGAVLIAGVGGARLRYRLEVQPAGLDSRGLTGSTTLPWAEITHVDRGTEALVVWGRGDAQIRVDTASFAGDQRAALERALARRIVESTQATR